MIYKQIKKKNFETKKAFPHTCDLNKNAKKIMSSEIVNKSYKICCRHLMLNFMKTHIFSFYKRKKCVSKSVPFSLRCPSLCGIAHMYLILLFANYLHFILCSYIHLCIYMFYIDKYAIHEKNM